MLAPLDELMLNFAVQLQEAVRTFIKMQLDAELQSFFFFSFFFFEPNAVSHQSDSLSSVTLRSDA